MRPVRATPAHKTDRLAELVCSNTFKSTELTNAHGLLKAEMRAARLDDPRGGRRRARARRERARRGSRAVRGRACTSAIASHPRIRVAREEVTTIPSPGIVATGPLTSDALAEAIRARLGVESLAFYDAIAPIVARESIDDAIVFRASRYGQGDDGGRRARARISTAR